MIVFRMIGRYQYGMNYCYNFDLDREIWVREDNLVSFTTENLIRLVKNDYINVVKYDFNLLSFVSKISELESSIKESYSRQKTLTIVNR